MKIEESLHDDCLNWGESGCHPEVQKWFAQEITGEDAIPIKPAGSGLKALDEICRSCEKRLFKAKDLNCVTCGGTLERLKVSVMNKGEETYAYPCSNCKTPHISSLRLV